MQNNRVVLTTKQLTKVAVLIALAVVLKSFLSFETGSFRFTFYEIPMMVIGILFGPIIGGATGIIVDFFHMMFSPWAFTFNVFTISNMMWAIVPGIILFNKKFTRSKVIVAVVIASFIAFFLNTYGIYQFRGIGEMYGTLPYRIGVLFIKLPLQVMALEIIYNRVLVLELKLLKQR